MCLNPRYIPLRANVSHYYARSRNLVPCGCCEECANALSLEWSSRLVGEYLDCDGVTLFPTLTYRNSCCPVFNIDNEQISYGYYYKSKDFFPCFSKDDIQRFLNTLRKKLERVGYYGLRYFVACEYGVDVTRTQRPHYHAMLFFKKHINLPCTYKLIEYVADSWHYGTVRYSKKHGAVVKSYLAAKYASKYCCKDILFFGDNNVRKYLDESLSKDELCRRKTILKDYKPRHYQSKAFGFGLYKYVPSDISTNVDTWLNVRNNGFSIDGIDETFFLHRYLLDRLRYDYHYDYYTYTSGKELPVCLDYTYRTIKKGFEKTLLPSDYDYLKCLDKIDKFKNIPLHDGKLPNCENDTLELARYMMYQQDRLHYNSFSVDDCIDDYESYASTYFLYKPFGRMEFNGVSYRNPLYDKDLDTIFAERSSNALVYYEKKYNNKYLFSCFNQ